MGLAQFILDHLAPIMRDWETFASRLPAGGALNVEELRDHAEAMLRAIAADMVTEQSQVQQFEKSEGRGPRLSAADTGAESHAFERFGQGFDINALVSEYRALRASVVRHWTAVAAPLRGSELQELIRFDEAIDQAVAESVARFTAQVEQGHRQARRQRAAEAEALIESEARARASEIRLRAIIDQLPVGVALVDKEGSFIVSNGLMDALSLRSIASRDPNAHGRWHALDDNGRLLPTDQWPGARALRGESVRPGIVFTFTDEHGVEQQQLVGATPFRDEGGHIAGAIVVSQDVTPLRRAEREVEALLRRQTRLTDNTPLAVVEWDADFRITRWSGQSEQLFGWRPDEAIGKAIDELPIVHPEDAATVRAVCEQLLDARNQSVVSRNRNLTRSGETITCEWHNSVLRDASGRLVAVLSLVLDVTAQLRAVEGLRERELWLQGQRHALEAALNGLPLEASLGALSDTAVDALGDGTRAAFHLADERGTVLNHVVGMPARYAEAVNGFSIGPESLACGLAAHIGQPVITPDVTREPRWAPWLWLAERFDFRGSWNFPILSAAGRCVGTLAIYSRMPRDATPRDRELASLLTHTASIILSHHNESQARRRAEQALRDADRRKDEFLATLSHELRNPLAPIRQAAAVGREPKATPAQVRWSLDVIERQARHMTLLLDDLLDVSRITGGRLAIHPVALRVADVVEAAVETARPHVEARRHRLEITLPADPLWLDGDPLRLAQVLSNLLTNAAKYTESGGLIRVGARRDGNCIELAVSDNGVGIAPEDIGSVFEMFSQGHAPSHLAAGGLGIGLALARGLIALHGGTIEARSDGLGKGSTFVVRLPLRVEPGVAPGPKPDGSGAAHGARRILVVDDNVDAADSLAALLRLQGHDVHVAHGGEAALAAFAALRPEVMLLDLGMPGIDGLEVARRIRADCGGRGVMLVALSGWGRPEDRRRTEAAGFDHHLTKPVDADTLEGILAMAPSG